MALEARLRLIGERLCCGSSPPGATQNKTTDKNERYNYFFPLPHCDPPFSASTRWIRKHRRGRIRVPVAMFCLIFVRSCRGYHFVLLVFPAPFSFLFPFCLPARYAWRGFHAKNMFLTAELAILWPAVLPALTIFLPTKDSAIAIPMNGRKIAKIKPKTGPNKSTTATGSLDVLCRVSPGRVS